MEPERVPDTLLTGRLLGRHLSEWRRARELSQNTAARRAGISRSTLSKLERGDTSVSVDTLLRLAAVYNITDSLIAGLNPLNGKEVPNLLLGLLRTRVHD